jgi:hypothetical protein
MSDLVFLPAHQLATTIRERKVSAQRTERPQFQRTRYTQHVIPVFFN